MSQIRHNIKSNVWKNSEDATLVAAVMKYGKTDWGRVASLLPRKSAKQCKARWEEWLDPRIKKTDWTREEDEKLLHYARILNSQWRTISTMMNRTAYQCVDRYNFLINEARKAEGQGYNEEDNPNQIRPGEIDPNPEIRPARPDPKDMDKEEIEMLDEVRARLANTYGKKANRKAREREMERVRRMAASQKRREMKNAGIDVIRRTLRKHHEIDYNREIPFQRTVPAGYYDPSDDIGEGEYDFSKQKRTIEDIEGVSRNQREEREKERDKKKLQKLFKENLPEAVVQLNKIDERKNIFNIKRTKLNLPAPQVNENDINQLISDGYGTDEPSGFNTAALPTPVSYTPLPSAVRTPMTTNIVMNEAINQLHEKMAPTPLAILNRSEDSQDTYEASKHLQGTGNTTAQPMVNHAVTPNLYKMNTPMATPGFSLGLSTPMGTPYSGSLSAPEGIQENDRQELHDLFQALPKSQYDRSSYDVSLEELNELEETHMKKEEEVVDLTVLEQDIKRQEQELYQYEYAHRSEALKRDLPVALPPKTFKSNSTNEIDRLLRLEMYDLLKYDIYKWVYPEKAKGPVTKEMLSEEQILAGTAMIDEETQLMDHSSLTEEDVTRYYQMKKAKYLYNPTTKSFCYIDDLSAEDKKKCMQYLYNLYSGFFNDITKKVNSLENNVTIQMKGYADLESKAVEAFNDTVKSYNDNLIERDIFKSLYQQEHLNIDLRIKAYEALVKEEKERNRALQNRYKTLVHHN